MANLGEGGIDIISFRYSLFELVCWYADFHGLSTLVWIPSLLNCIISMDSSYTQGAFENLLLDFTEFTYTAFENPQTPRF